jgi:hypothetical protein
MIAQIRRNLLDNVRTIRAFLRVKSPRKNQKSSNPNLAGGVYPQKISIRSQRDEEQRVMVPASDGQWSIMKSALRS